VPPAATTGAGKVSSGSVPTPMFMNPMMMAMMARPGMGGMPMQFFGVGAAKRSRPKGKRSKDKPDYKCRRCGKVKAKHVCPFKSKSASFTTTSSEHVSYHANRPMAIVFGRSIGTQTAATGIQSSKNLNCRGGANKSAEEVGTVSTTPLPVEVAAAVSGPTATA
jgi:hypothetical protein